VQESLFNDAKYSENKKIVDKRKCDIGKGCLQQLLMFFLDSGVTSTMRRWVSGILNCCNALLTTLEGWRALC
jgi:hypothetical protein